MVRIDRVVTRGGDKGETSLGDGSRVPKHGARACAIGEVDEANAAVGWLGVAAPDHASLLRSIQNALFDLGADLCVPGTEGNRLRLTDAPVVWLERAIATMNAKLPPLRSFVLPGGTEAAARAHLARTVVRRAERAVVRIASEEAINPALVRYLKSTVGSAVRACARTEQRRGGRYSVAPRRRSSGTRSVRSRGRDTAQ